MTDQHFAAAPVDEEGDAGQRYADQVNAPLSRETLEALRAELQSEERARFRKPRRREQGPNDG